MEIMEGVFRQTADTRATQYMGTVARDKGRGEPGPKDQLNRYYGRSEHQPYMNPYHGRPVIDQTLGDQFGAQRYELDVGLQVKNIIMADAEQPWMTIIMPLNNTDALTITGTIWRFNRRLPRPTPYHAPSPYVTEEYEQFYGQLQRYGESIRMESDFYHTEEGMRNFALKLTGIASDMIEGIRYDVLREMIRAIEEYKRYYNLHTYTQDPTKDIRSRVALFAALNKAPTKENQLGVTIERLERALRDVVPGPYEVIVPPEWGIFFHSINQTPAPQPYYLMGDIMVENGPTPKGQIGKNRYWEYPDIIVETGAPRLRLLDRKTIVAEYYQSIFKEGNSALCTKLTGLLSSDKDIGRMRNLFVYSADEDKYVEVDLEDMVKHSALLPDTYKENASLDDDPMRHGEKYVKLKTDYIKEGEKALDKFHPLGDLPGGPGGKAATHMGISGTIRRAPMFLFYEPKDMVTSRKVPDRWSHVRRVKYSGETDDNVQSYRDHINQGEVLCAHFIHTSLGMTDLGARYTNAIRLRSTLRDAPCTNDYVKNFILVNIHNSLDVTYGVDGNPNSAMFSGSRLNDTEYEERWGASPTTNAVQLATTPGGYYIIPPQADTGVSIPPGCDCAVGLASLAHVDPDSSGYNSSIINAAIDHYNVLVNMVEKCKDLPDSELINPLNRAPWVHTQNEEVSSLDYAYSTAVSQLWSPLFVAVPQSVFIEEQPLEIGFGDTPNASGIFAPNDITTIRGGAAPGERVDLGGGEGLGDESSEYLDESARIPPGSVSLQVTRGAEEGPAAGSVFWVRTGLAFTPGIKNSVDAKQTTMVESGFPKESFSRPSGAVEVTAYRVGLGRRLPAEGEIDEDNYGYDPEDLVMEVDATINRSVLRTLTPPVWVNGSAKTFEHYPQNLIHGVPAGMNRAGAYPKAPRRSGSSTRRTRSSGEGSSRGSIRRGLLRSTSSGRRRGRRAGKEREVPSLSDHASQDLDYLSAGAREPVEYTEEERVELGFAHDRGDVWNAGPTWVTDENILRDGHKMTRRFRGSNFIAKMREITTRQGDPVTFFTIAAMKSRQDRKEDLMKLVKNRLHVAFNFLLFRLPELHMESAILCKAGLGMTIVNNSDYKNGETVATKTYHGHLTVHYGAIVTKRDWQLMLEDMRCNGYIQGKGSGFLRHPNDLMAASRSQGKRNRSFICYAQPIAKVSRTLPPFLSLSGKWEMPDVVPRNLPESGHLYHGCDWYDMVWKWHDSMARERPKYEYFKSKGYTWPQVALRGWHAEYNLSQGRFQVASHGHGHLAGSDYPGAVAVLNGDASWFDPPPKTQLELY